MVKSKNEKTGARPGRESKKAVPKVVQKSVETEVTEAPSQTPGGRRVRRCWWRQGLPFYIIRISNGSNGTTDYEYLLERIEDVLFRITKLQPKRATTYTVMIGRVKSCSCDGFMHRKECKHVDAIMKLESEGKL